MTTLYRRWAESGCGVGVLAKGSSGALQAPPSSGVRGGTMAAKWFYHILSTVLKMASTDTHQSVVIFTALHALLHCIQRCLATRKLSAVRLSVCQTRGL